MHASSILVKWGETIDNLWSYWPPLYEWRGHYPREELVWKSHFNPDGLLPIKKIQIIMSSLNKEQGKKDQSYILEG